MSEQAAAPAEALPALVEPRRFAFAVRHTTQTPKAGETLAIDAGLALRDVLARYPGAKRPDVDIKEIP